ncbi:MAG: hypothetical protein ITG00_05950 [Flavobacterium sp.]|nr:hypothetical protein [Flavobacterium sp.]
MKKKLEAELISIAHRILKIKDKSDIEILHKEAQKLFEKLSVLRFLEENFEGAKPTIGRSEIENRFESGFDYKTSEISIEEKQPETAAVLSVEEKSTEANQPKIISEPQERVEEEQPVVVEDQESEKEVEVVDEEPSKDERAEAAAAEPTDSRQEEITHNLPGRKDFTPSFELSFDAEEAQQHAQKEEASTAKPQFTFDDLLGKDYVDPVFIKPEEVVAQRSSNQEITPKGDAPEADQPEKKDRKLSSLNDRLSKGITIGLNDRIAFMKHLFGNSSEDYNRVLSQLITFDTFEEAQTFIDEMVKPDYDNWNGKDEYSQRFMEIIERRFV